MPLGLSGAASVRLSPALASSPSVAGLGRVAGTRELVIPRLPFVVAYRITPDHVRGLAILHGARRWPSSFE